MANFEIHIRKGVEGEEREGSHGVPFPVCLLAC